MRCSTGFGRVGHVFYVLFTRSYKLFVVFALAGDKRSDGSAEKGGAAGAPTCAARTGALGGANAFPPLYQYHHQEGLIDRPEEIGHLKRAISLQPAL